MILENTWKIKASTEEEAKEIIEEYRNRAREGGYTIKKAGFERKEKKAKGEIVGEGYLVTITAVYAGFWEDLE